MARKLNVNVSELRLPETNPQQFQKTFYEKCFDDNSLPIECQNRESHLNESKKRQFWTRNCFQGFSTVLIADS